MEDLITVFKDGESIEIHPSTLRAHEGQGWKLVVKEKAQEQEAGSGTNLKAVHKGRGVYEVQDAAGNVLQTGLTKEEAAVIVANLPEEPTV